VVTLARRLRRKRPKGGQRSLRDIAAELAQRGHLNEHGRAVLGGVGAIDAGAPVPVIFTHHGSDAIESGGADANSQFE
jgi:hypothetical protein